MSGDRSSDGTLTPAGMRKHLVQKYPRCFRPKGKLKLPLKVGIHDDIVAREPWFTLAEVKAGLKDYTDGPKYLTQCVVGAARVNLDGDPVAKVKYWEAAHSARRLAALRFEWANKDNPSPTLGDILNSVLKVKDTVMLNTTTSGFLPGARKDRAPNLIDPLSLFDTIKTLINRSTFAARAEAVELIEARDRSNLEYGAEQAVAAGIARSVPGIHKSMEEVVRHMREGRKIEAIKTYRAVSGMGLKESKDFVESLQGIAGPAVTPVHTPYGIQPKDYIVLRKGGDYASFEDEGRYSNQTHAHDRAQGVSERYPDSETLLVKVIGRTKSVFSMVA